MGPCKQKTVIAAFESNSDIISSLPSEFITNILVKLPIKDAVRASILSSKWKHLSASIPILVFKQDSTESELIRLVDNVLLVHQGPILNFQLNCQKVCEEAINRWALILSQNRIQDLRFHILKNCTIPSRLFRCHTLKHLEITGCSINAPQCFQGFKLLRSLMLYSFSLIGISVEKLVSSCPLLENLILFNFVKHGCLTICAPNLRQLDLHGGCTDVSLDTPKLISAKIYLYCIAYDYQNFDLVRVGCGNKILCTLARLSSIEELVIDPEFCAYLASGLVPEELPVTFHHLKKIVIFLNGKEAVDAALCIFRNAPNLKSLSLTVPFYDVWEEQRITSISMFKSLKTVSIMCFQDSQSVLGFAKLVLSIAPELEKLVINVKENYFKLVDYLTFVMKLASFSRLSSKAVLLFDGNHSTFGHCNSR